MEGPPKGFIVVAKLAIAHDDIPDLMVFCSENNSITKIEKTTLFQCSFLDM